MRNHPGVTATFCEALSQAGINIETMNTSEIRISVICRVDQLDAAVRALHERVRAGRRGAGRGARGDGPMSETADGQADGASAVAAGNLGARPRDRRRHRRGRHHDDRDHRRAASPCRGREIRLVASPRSAGKVLRVRGEDVTVEALAPEVFDGVDVALFDVPDEVSARVGADRGGARRRGRRQLRARSAWTPTCRSSCPRSTRSRPRNRPKGIIANPNCTTLSMMAAMGALHREFELDRAGRGLVPGRVGGRAGRHRPAAGRDRRRGGPRGRACAAATSPRRWPPGWPADSPFPAPLALNVVPWAGRSRTTAGRRRS